MKRSKTMILHSKWAGLRAGGFALLVVSCALLASSGRTHRSSSEIGIDEETAIATLRTIAAAERAVRASGTIDTNCDRVGEYAYLAELAGTQPKRVCNQGIPAAGNTFTDRIARPLLRPELGTIMQSSAGLSGYRFEMWLPGPTRAGQVAGVREDSLGGKLAAPFPDSRNGAGLWCCYAWPVEVGTTGNRAFVVDREGIVLQCSNDSPKPFSGFTYVPQFGEAFVDDQDMSSGLRIGTTGGENHTIWTRVGE
jgi:hypothetical protein